MDASDSGNGRVTYAEVRRVARWLNAFTARELADAMHVHEAVGERFLVALVHQGICIPLDVWLPGPDGVEQLYEMEPLPEGYWPRIRRTPPEVQAVIEMYGGFILYNQRGLPVRLTHKGEKGRVMSTPGARQKQKLRDLAWERQQHAIRVRAEKERRKRIARTQGKRIVQLALAGMGNGADEVYGSRRHKKAGRKTK